jgi:hypothetical protein
LTFAIQISGVGVGDGGGGVFTGGKGHGFAALPHGGGGS